MKDGHVALKDTFDSLVALGEDPELCDEDWLEETMEEWRDDPFLLMVDQLWMVLLEDGTLSMSLLNALSDLIDRYAHHSLPPKMGTHGPA